MNLNTGFCPYCGIAGTQNNRIITDTCGHIKCKKCFLDEVDVCMQCEQQTKETELACNTDNATNINETLVQLKRNKANNKNQTIGNHIKKILNSDGTSRYQCTICLKIFKCRSQQYYHSACGSNESRKYKCDKCDKGFATKSHLKYHAESHRNTLYNCTQCQKTFKNSVVLKKHEKLHRNKAEACTECGKIFRNSMTLKNHMHLHDNKELFKHSCQICNKQYATKSTLQQHMLKHNAKQHECNICNRRFQRNSTLKLHMKRHSNTDCYVCTMCRKNFSDSAALLRHARAHEDSIKYYCTLCDITSIRKDNMLRHIRNIHLNANFEDCIKLLKSPMQNPVNSEPKTAEETLVQPKTVENSCVIKCIGNVKPVKIPKTTTAVQQSSCNNGNNNIIASKDLITKPEHPTYLQRSCVKTETKTAQKSKREPYDPIEMYRRILTIDDDDDEEIIEEITEDFPSHDVLSTTTLNETVTTPPYLLTHWRKNVMNSYEIDVEKCDEDLEKWSLKCS